MTEHAGRMEDFIEKKLCSIYEKFRRRARKEDKLCACKDIDFRPGKCPSYDQPLAQQFYLLRYLPAYMAEYHRLYTKAFNVLAHDASTLSVLSLGCGCGVDLWSLYFVLRGIGRDPHTCLKYLGIDQVKWCDKDTLDLPNATIRVRDVADAKTPIRKVLKDIDMIVFPKSLTDLSEAAFNAFAEELRQAPLKKDKIMVLASASAWGTSQARREDERLDHVSEVLRRHHGLELDAPSCWSYHGRKAEYARELWSGFDYPDSVCRQVEELRSLCGCRSACANSDCQLGRSPILTTAYAHLRVLRHARPPTDDLP